MMRPCALAAGGLLWLSVCCAVAQDGNSEKDKMRLLARPAQEVLPEELRANCAGLTVTIKTRIDRLREYLKLAKKEQEGGLPTLFGDRPAADDAAKERQRVEALNVVLDAKGCSLVNIDEELQKSPPPPVAAKETNGPIGGRKKSEK